MASSKDTFEAKTFAANTFACGSLRGLGVEPEPEPTPAPTPVSTSTVRAGAGHNILELGWYDGKPWIRHRDRETAKFMHDLVEGDEGERRRRQRQRAEAIAVAMMMLTR